jgi:hypothetical protein
MKHWEQKQEQWNKINESYIIFLDELWKATLFISTQNERESKIIENWEKKKHH